MKLCEMYAWDKVYCLPDIVVSKALEEKKREGGKTTKKSFGM